MLRPAPLVLAAALVVAAVTGAACGQGEDRPGMVTGDDSQTGSTASTVSTPSTPTSTSTTSPPTAAR